MRLLKEKEEEVRLEIEKFIDLTETKTAQELFESGQLREILIKSFRNRFLTLVTINGKRFPANAKEFIGKNLAAKTTFENIHTIHQNLRIDFDEESNSLVKERRCIEKVRELKLVPDILGTISEPCLVARTVEKTFVNWIRFGKPIPIERIKFIRIEKFQVKPAIRLEGKDYTAYKIILSTR